MNEQGSFTINTPDPSRIDADTLKAINNNVQTLAKAVWALETRVATLEVEKDGSA